MDITIAYVKRLLEDIESRKYFINEVERRKKEGYYDKALDDLKKKIEELQRNLENLRKLENLYERALEVMEKDKCPVCGSTIRRSEVERKLMMLRYELSNRKDELVKLIMKRNEIYAELNEYEKKKKELEKLLEEYRRIAKEHPEILKEDWVKKYKLH
jgi:DNA repair exonuclease SbcCD ATPase subunit